MINKEYDRIIKKWLENNREDIIDEWIKLAEIPSVMSEPEDGAPYGKECARALKASAELFEKSGFKTNIYDKGYALADFGDNEKTIGFFCHSDVVPVGDDWIYTEPFRPVIKNNTLIGRGVSDNKSGIMASYCVLKMAKELDFPINSRLRVFIGSNEETGMEDIDAFTKEHPMPDISFVPDAEFPCSIGEKGICSYWAKSGTPLNDITEFHGGEAFNVVLDKVTVKLRYSNALFEEISSKVSEKSEYTVTSDGNSIVILAKGIAKHASEPDGSVNAAYLAASILSECEYLNKSDREQMCIVAKLTESGFGEGIGLVHEDSHFGRLTMANGMADVCNGNLKISFNTRYGSEISAQEVEDRTRHEFNKLGWSIEDFNNMEGFDIPESEVTKMLESVYNEITGKEEPLCYLGGGTYARHLKNAFSIGTEEGRPNGFEMPEGHGGPHQCDEMIDIDGFFEAVRIIMHFVLEYEKI